MVDIISTSIFVPGGVCRKLELEPGGLRDESEKGN